MRLGNRSSITTGEKTVTIPGNAVLVHDNLPIPEGFELCITAKHSNAGRIYIGGTQAQAEAKTLSLGKDDPAYFAVTNANKVFIFADNNGEGIDYGVEQ